MLPFEAGKSKGQHAFLESSIIEEEVFYWEIPLNPGLMHFPDCTKTIRFIE